LCPRNGDGYPARAADPDFCLSRGWPIAPLF